MKKQLFWMFFLSLIQMNSFAAKEPKSDGSPMPPPGLGVMPAHMKGPAEDDGNHPTGPEEEKATGPEDLNAESPTEAGSVEAGPGAHPMEAGSVEAGPGAHPMAGMDGQPPEEGAGDTGQATGFKAELKDLGQAVDQLRKILGE